jgi:AraC-like DNA-binding protein
MADDPPIAYQRAGPLAALPGMLTTFGRDPAEVFAGLDGLPDEIGPDTGVPAITFLAMLHRAARALGSRHLGLVLAGGADHRAMGLIGRLMANAPTVRQALLDFVEWQAGQSRVAAAYLIPIGEEAAFGYGLLHRAAAGADQAYDLVMAMACNIVRGLGGADASPREVLFSHRRPEDRRPYDDLFRAPLRFDQDQSCLILPRAILDRPVLGADAGERERALAEVQAAVAANPNDTAARVRHALRPRLPFGDVSLPETAGHLGLHPRTLGRQLAREGTTFEAVRDQTRFAVAQELLMLTDLPVGDVAEALSYASHSAFVHAFQRWAGRSPSTWRAARRPSR